MSRPAICSHCGSKGDLVSGVDIYPHRPDLSPLSFWKCVSCNAFVGCHRAGAKVPTKNGRVTSDGTLPLGTMANAELRRLRSLVHNVFDPYWKLDAYWVSHPAFTPVPRNERRRALYKWLAEKLNIKESQCHVGLFTLDECTRTISLIGALPQPK